MSEYEDVQMDKHSANDNPSQRVLDLEAELEQERQTIAELRTKTKNDPQYRMLEIGEVIQEGDEYQIIDGLGDRHKAPWGPVLQAAVGKKLYSENAGHFRRRVVNNPKPLASGQPAQGTPRTDALADALRNDGWNVEVAPLAAALAKARTLETALAEKTAEIARKDKVLKTLCEDHAQCVLGETEMDELLAARAEIAALTAENARLCEGNSSMEKEIPQLRHEVARLTKERDEAISNAESWERQWDRIVAESADYNEKWNAAIARAERLRNILFQVLHQRTGPMGMKIEDDLIRENESLYQRALAAALEETK